MSDFDNTNRGAMFKNDTEGKSEGFPPYGGSLNVDGVDYWISGWVKEGSKGKFFSLSVKPKEQRQESRPQRQAPAPANDFVDDDLPF
jgi:hypothetical protein